MPWGYSGDYPAPHPPRRGRGTSELPPAGHRACVAQGCFGFRYRFAYIPCPCPNLYSCGSSQPSSSTVRGRRGRGLFLRQQQWSERGTHPSRAEPKGPRWAAWSTGLLPGDHRCSALQVRGLFSSGSWRPFTWTVWGWWAPGTAERSGLFSRPLFSGAGRQRAHPSPYGSPRRACPSLLRVPPSCRVKPSLPFSQISIPY